MEVCAFDREKNAKSRKEKEEKKRKERNKERKKESEKVDKLKCLDRIRARASPPAVSFACLKLHHAAKETKYKIRSISEYYVTITRPGPLSEKETLLTRFQIQTEM